ncbi:hypothetical protein [Methylopila sp. M107]|uniref:hypothetical protein n=1 Tax=Methylopila sp. M107 TaxID=1101190 RepID=UPI00036FC5CE|nr:hypothetical protein [Methylopila sp. M107]
MRPSSFRIAALCSALLLSAAPASAQAYSDWFSGLKVAPPQGYAAAKIPPRGSYSVLVSVKRPEDRDTGCQVGFTKSDANKALTQAGVNLLMRQKEYHELARAILGVFFTPRATRTVQYGDVAGLEIVADIKQRPGIPARAAAVRASLVMLQTPKGRTAVV